VRNKFRAHLKNNFFFFFVDKKDNNQKERGKKNIDAPWWNEGLVYKGPIPPRNVEMVFHQVLLYQRKLESDQGRKDDGVWRIQKEQQKLQLFTQKERKLGWSWKIHN